MTSAQPQHPSGGESVRAPDPARDLAPDPALGSARRIPVADGARRRPTGTRKPWLVACTRPFGQVLFRSVFRMRVVGTEHVPRQGAVLVAGNHTGFLDGPLVYVFCPRPATFLAKSELFVGPLARALGWLGQVPVHRGRPDRTALHAGLDVLAAGGALGVFPEGTRGAGTLEEVSDGLGWLALRSGVPVVPLAVLGTAEALPKGARRPRLRAPVTLVFGPPVHLDVPGDPRARRTVRTAAEELRLALVAHLRSATESCAGPPLERDA
jgi:1-acyl-sn-glycerol-3-phosphate acyltransferase